MDIQPGDCVQISDGRIARVRDNRGDTYRVRVKRKTSNTHQFLIFDQDSLSIVPCPKGWMSPEGYNRYLAVTLEKMKQRKEESASR